MEDARNIVLDTMSYGPIRFAELWPNVLEETHITLHDLKRIVRQLQEDGTLVIEGVEPRDRTVKYDHLLRLAARE